MSGARGPDMELRLGRHPAGDRNESVHSWRPPRRGRAVRLAPRLSPAKPRRRAGLVRRDPRLWSTSARHGGACEMPVQPRSQAPVSSSSVAIRLVDHLRRLRDERHHHGPHRVARRASARAFGCGSLRAGERASPLDPGPRGIVRPLDGLERRVDLLRRERAGATASAHHAVPRDGKARASRRPPSRAARARPPPAQPEELPARPWCGPAATRAAASAIASMPAARGERA